MGPSTLCENETLSGIGVVDGQKLFFLDFQNARATLCGDRMVDVQKLRFFSAIPAGIGVVEVQKLMVVLRFSIYPGDLLRGSVWSM